MGLFDDYFDPDQFDTSRGLLGRLLSVQRRQGGLPDWEFDSQPPAPPVPQLSPLDLVNYAQALLAQNGTAPYGALPSATVGPNATFGSNSPAYENTPFAQAPASLQQFAGPSAVNSAGYPGPVASDASPDPIKSGAQYAQTPLPMALCGLGPVGCGVGAGFSIAPAILGAAAWVAAYQ